jgi:hypothetical protein
MDEGFGVDASTVLHIRPIGAGKLEL